MTISILFASECSNYKRLPNIDVWDRERNALLWGGGNAVVAHPPCRAWASLKHHAKPEPGEKYLALWAADMVRAYGGVLEHPARSELWKEKPLPEPGEIDGFGGIEQESAQDCMFAEFLSMMFL